MGLLKLLIAIFTALEHHGVRVMLTKIEPHQVTYDVIAMPIRSTMLEP